MSEVSRIAVKIGIDYPLFMNNPEHPWVTQVQWLRVGPRIFTLHLGGFLE